MNAKSAKPVEDFAKHLEREEHLAVQVRKQEEEVDESRRLPDRKGVLRSVLFLVGW